MVSALGDLPGAIWLDPCVGDGAFVGGMVAVKVPKSRILALDLATQEEQRDRLAQTTRGADFIKWASERAAICDRVVMNPPYVALSRLRGRPRRAALAVVVDEGAGRKMALKANYWCAFILSGMRALRVGGAMAAVLPAAWDYARYARRIREAVASGFGEVTVIRSASPLFPGVLDGAVVVVAKQRGAQPCVSHRVEVEDAAAVVQALKKLAAGSRVGVTCGLRSVVAKPRQEAKLSDLLDVRIGGVTGDAHYFLMTESERKDRGIPKDALRPVVTRCKHLRRPILDSAEWNRLLKADERVWLFSPSGVILDHPAVSAYIAEGEEGACQTERYKIAARTPWYKTPMPRGVDGFLSGMSKRLPFLVMRSMERLTATNTLYIVRFKPSLDRATRFAIGVSLLSSAVRRQLEARARVYADGLLKFEPAELASVQVVLPTELLGARVAFMDATSLLLAGSEREAEAMADGWLDGDSSELVKAPVSRRSRLSS